MPSTDTTDTIFAPVSVQAIDTTHQIFPQFIRLPKPGTHCPWTGLSRGKLNELVLPTEANHNRPPVRSVSLRPPGALKGVRLIHLESLLKFLRDHLEGGSEPATEKEIQREAITA